MKKYIVSISEDNNKTIVTRYLKENFLMKSKFFILLYSIYLIYARMYIYKFNLDISLMKKVSLETSFHFLVLYFIILLVKSKEIMILEKKEIIIKKFFTFICYFRKLWCLWKSRTLREDFYVWDSLCLDNFLGSLFYRNIIL